MVQICIGAGRVDVLLTINVTLFNIWKIWIFRSANEGVPEQFYHFHSYNSVDRNSAVGIVTVVRTRRSRDRIPVFDEISRNRPD